jgi:hypothetical protein
MDRITNLKRTDIMLKFTSLALATIIGASTLIPSTASAIDNGPCDHCTMDPIVVTGGDDPEKDKESSSRPASPRGKIRR